jgi:hypothetical protein
MEIFVDGLDLRWKLHTGLVGIHHLIELPYVGFLHPVE